MKYDELVKALRETATFTKFDDLLSKREQKLESLAFDAAAAIEDLEGFLSEAERDRDEYEERMRKEQERVLDLQARLEEAENSVERWKDMYLTKHEPKRGEWVETEEKEWGIYPFKKQTCSVCDCKIDHIFMLACMDYFDDRDTVFHYCPNCGAEMEVQDG